MISEGTRITEKENLTEEDIENEVIEKISNFNGLVIVDYPIRDLDRLLTFYKAAINTDRTLVIN
ncbi:hypothetical protein MTTB_03550 [Methanothermobacter tenebrarum]|jgi:ribonuclease J|uniref:Uncharacterized protein n=1 Tax=Methanothermobacter tenebrarum TaxID=680118 RepID=A0ABN6PDV7_9EURY|nr:hypothetical protein [Methanothermobacter tenebrarum]MDD3454166.1 hypothetical protein [Methanobacteriales archaeon]MDX9693427.1 hypothetical protein [Methanothermobacter sp.]BDH78976.1 hypothetical protein MTTB_03550 [Methanothermobacter tenebrarum]